MSSAPELAGQTVVLIGGSAGIGLVLAWVAYRRAQAGGLGRSFDFLGSRRRHELR